MLVNVYVLYVCMCACVYVSVCMHACMCVCVCVCMCLCSMCVRYMRAHEAVFKCTRMIEPKERGNQSK